MNASKTCDEMSTFDGDLIEAEIGKTGIERTLRAIRREAGQKSQILNGNSLSDHGEAWTGQRIPVTRCAVEQQRHPRIERNVPAVLCQVGQQKERARIEISSRQDERGVRRAPHARGKHGALPL